MKSIIQLFSPLLLGLILAFNISTASAATCDAMDVSTNLGADTASACTNNPGNDRPNYQDNINSNFGLDGTLFWSHVVTNNEVGDGDIDITFGQWDITSYAISNPFVIVVKAGNQNAGAGLGFASYLFNVGSNGLIDWSTKGLDLKGVSHLSLYTSTGGTGEVPLPAAIWLFGSALMGLVGIRKRYTA